MKALIATAAGLLLPFHAMPRSICLVVKIDRIVLDMEKAASEMVAFITDPDRQKETAEGK